jgi:hypothetical protein
MRHGFKRRGPKVFMGLVPKIIFRVSIPMRPAVQPVRVVFCHGKLYACNAYGGGITEFTFDSSWDVKAKRVVINTPAPFKVANKSQWSILGLACDPRDDDADFKLYFTHSLLYGQQGTAPTTAAPYMGSVRPHFPGWRQVQSSSILEPAFSRMCHPTNRNFCGPAAFDCPTALANGRRHVQHSSCVGS